MIARAIRQYIGRFRWEIGIFWLLSITASLTAVWDAEPSVRLGLARLEIIALVWITIRLLLAEDGFKVTGGWRARPVSNTALIVSQGLLLVGVIGIAIGFRGLLFQRLLDLDSTGWRILLHDSWRPQITGWLGFAAAVKLFGLLILRGIDGRPKLAAWAALAIIVIPLVIFVCQGVNGSRDNYGSGGSHEDLGELGQGIQQQLPDGTDFIGSWFTPVDSGEIVPSASLLMRVPLSPTGAIPNGKILQCKSEVLGSRVTARIRIIGVDSSLLFRAERAKAVIHYSDGTYATCGAHVRIRNSSLTPLLTLREFGFCGVFLSPLSQPEFEGDIHDLLAGAELLFFESGGSGPSMQPTPDRVSKRFESLKKLTELNHLKLQALADSPGKTEEFARLLVHQYNLYGSMAGDINGLQGFCRKLPTGALPTILNCFPWSDMAWSDLVRPFLMEHASREDLPVLLKRMEIDPRIGSVLIEKGWTAEAMPLLTRFANDRLPLDTACIKALVTKNDPGLTEDIMANALQLRWGLSEIEPALRKQPGFEWSRFAEQIWKQAKYRYNKNYEDGQTWLMALWAAQEGDFSAFRHTAEQAALGKKWEAEQLKGLVAGEHGDLLAYLRENIDAMTFDPVSRKWVR